MPLIRDRDLPTYERLRGEGHHIIDIDRAHTQDIRELHIGLYNMMPDAALEATERQFFRLIGASNRVVQLHIHPFAPRNVKRSDAARAHIEKHYTPSEAIFESGLDGLIISGANPLQPQLDAESFWPELCELFDWAEQSVTSTLCSCLATHAHLLYRHGIQRQALAHKCWGVFPQQVVTQQVHPLVRGVNTRFSAIHSRWNDVPISALEDNGLPVLIAGEDSGFYIASSKDGIRFVYLQGHPEYDTNSLLKEYKRELIRWLDRNQAKPPFVSHYFSAQAKAIIDEFCDEVQRGQRSISEFPEALLETTLDNSWRDTSRALLSNWIGTVYQLTHVERDKPFMSHIDPDNPLDTLR